MLKVWLGAWDWEGLISGLQLRIVSLISVEKKMQDTEEKKSFKWEPGDC